MAPYPLSGFQPARFSRLIWLATLLVPLSIVLCPVTADAAEVFSLTNKQRKKYLEYYAPVILKSASESSFKGRDWITNFAFERDKTFSNNRTDWENKLSAYVDGNSQYAAWRIRPTLYTALIEFKEGTGKSVVLLYHVYHAMEEGDVHDWERVEIRVDNVSGTPGGGGEKVLYVLATEHSMHVPRPLANVQFMQVSGGGWHPLILQGSWIDGGTLERNELRHVTTSWNTIDNAFKGCTLGACATAIVDATNGTDKITTAQRVNYVFVPESDAPAVDYWHAVEVAPGLDGKLNDKTAGTSAAVKWSAVKRLTYELQDLADILPTHADTMACGTFPTEQGWDPAGSHWSSKSDKMSILMTEAIKGEGKSGAVLVPTSANCGGKPIVNYCYSLDGTDNKTAQGYPCKHWFWGAYVTGMDDASYTDEMYQGDGFYLSKSDKNPRIRNCRNAAGDVNPYWCQHDYFAHLGIKGNNSDEDKPIEQGRWLPVGWQKASEGGFDGRWVQLFPDKY